MTCGMFDALEGACVEVSVLALTIIYYSKDILVVLLDRGVAWRCFSACFIPAYANFREDTKSCRRSST